MTLLKWTEEEDWESSQSSDGVVFEDSANTDHNDSHSIKRGYKTSDVTPSNPFIYLPMHEYSGDIAYDFSGNQRHGTVSNATGGQDGLLDTTSYSFTTTSSVIVSDVPESSGGDVTTKIIDGKKYRIHTFTNVGSSTFTVDGGANVDALIVGGGGAGLGYGGGGGGGEVVHATDYSIDSGSYTVDVGRGGIDPGYQNSTDSNWPDHQGDPSSAIGITAKGGGGGHPTNQSDINGPDPNGVKTNVGNGGGGSSRSAGYYGDVDSGTAYIDRYGGKRGGQEDYGSNSTNSDENYPSGGGGGAGESITGDTGSGGNGSPGGDGVPVDILGTTYYWGGGGGGATYYSRSGTAEGGDGGKGGGGAGSGRAVGASGGSGYNDGQDAQNDDHGGEGGANTGGGGGAGSGDNNHDGADGGSGIVVIRLGPL